MLLPHLTFVSVPLLAFFIDIDSQLEKTKLDQVYVTALSADEGLLWVGTSVGVTLLFPLPRLEGVPLVSGVIRIFLCLLPLSYLLSTLSISVMIREGAPVFQKVDSSIDRINQDPLDSAVDFFNTYPLNSVYQGPGCSKDGWRDPMDKSLSTG